MLALLLSLGFFAYCIFPGLIFRTIFSFFLPLRSFERTKAQEIKYVTLVCVVPYALALLLVWWVPLTKEWPLALPDTPAMRATDYRLIATTSFSDSAFDTDVKASAFWDAAGRCVRRQGRMLFWYYAGMTALALAAGLATRNFPSYAPLQRIFHGYLVPNISEWHALLTPWLYPGATRIDVTVLTKDDHLFKGQVMTHTVDVEGRLTGLYLEKAHRYDRAGYLKKKEECSSNQSLPKPKPADFWRFIEGRRLFLFADAIQSLNVLPVYPEPLALIQMKMPDTKLDLIVEGAVEEGPPAPNVGPAVDPKP